jgi:hypothetical protein
MLSEIVSLLTFYNFDRNNIFFNSAPRILHTHWLREIDRNRSIYIVRNPSDVLRSVAGFAKGRGLSLSDRSGLNSKSICSSSWIDHVEFYRTRGYLIVDYNRLVERDAYTVNLISKHLSVPESFVLESLALMRFRYLHVNNPVDKNLKKIKTLQAEQEFDFNIDAEIAYYADFLNEYNNQ